MTKAAFIVEGDLEQAFVQNICPGAPVRKIGCNGDSVSVEAIAKRVGTLSRLLQRSCTLLIVVFDREKRVESCAEIQQALRDALSCEGITARLVIGIPDRDIETWIVADGEMLRASAALGQEICISPCEGSKGKTRIKLLLNSHAPYVETVHGPLWLKKARPTEIARHSASFAGLLNELSDLDCWWLKDSTLL